MTTLAAPQPLPNVTRWSALTQLYGNRYGVPPAVLLALIHEETRGQEGETSSAGAGGLTQFMPGTARTYNVDTSPGHASSQIAGAAHYLHDLGFAKDPVKALASYNAGPGNPQAGVGYADQVLELAKLYGHTPLNPPPASAAPAPAAASSDPLIGAKERSGALKFVLTGGFVLLGVALTWQGLNQLTGGSLQHGAGLAVRTAAVAA